MSILGNALLVLPTYFIYILGASEAKRRTDFHSLLFYDNTIRLYLHELELLRKRCNLHVVLQRYVVLSYLRTAHRSDKFPYSTTWKSYGMQYAIDWMKNGIHNHRKNSIYEFYRRNEAFMREIIAIWITIRRRSATNISVLLSMNRIEVFNEQPCCIVNLCWSWNIIIRNQKFTPDNCLIASLKQLSCLAPRTHCQLHYAKQRHSSDPGQ